MMRVEEVAVATATRVSTSANDIAAVSALHARSADEQAAALAQVTGTVEALNRTFAEIAIAAGQVSTAAEQALLSAANGQEAVRAGIAGMTRINGRINEIVARNLTLAAQSQRVGLIMETISALAAQTHGLVVNAAHDSASNAGVLALTKSLGKELATSNVVVTCVTPAVIATDILKQSAQSHIDYMLSKIPMGRFGNTTEAAALVAIFDETGRVLGLGEVDSNHTLHPNRLFTWTTEAAAGGEK